METSFIYDLRFISDLTEGPNGQPLLLYSDIERPEKDPPKYRSRLALWDDGLRFLTQNEAKNPAYHGDFIYFTRRVDKANQLFRLPLGGGEAEQLTQFKAGVRGYKLSPDGQRIALLSQGDYELPKPDEPKVFDQWPHKFDGAGFATGPTAQLWLWEQGQVRPWLQTNEPLDELVWGLQSDGVYVVKSGSQAEKWGWVQRLYWLDLQGQLSELLGGAGPITGLEPTPDGGLVYLAHGWERQGGTHLRLHHRSLQGEVRVLGEGSFLNSINSDCRLGGGQQSPKVGPDGAVYVVQTDHGSARIRRYELSGASDWVSPEGESVLGFAFCGGNLYALTETPTHPARLQQAATVLYDPNPGLSALSQPVELIHADGDHKVQGWVLLPDGPGPHPVILYIHGGPHTAFGHAPILQLQQFRARGYAVAYCNPRGSTGYTQDFTDLGTRWGDIDEADLLGFLQSALNQFPLDPNRVAVSGGSYGGYMTNWLTARHPQRFKAAVTDRSICNWFSFFGAADIGPRFAWLQLGAKPWERPEVLWEKSPLSLVHQVQTPTLVVHSEQDHRCPIDQGETWYTLLLQKGVPTRFFRCPEEGHELSRSGRPDRRVARLEAYLEWFKTHL